MPACFQVENFQDGLCEVKLAPFTSDRLVKATLQSLERFERYRPNSFKACEVCACRARRSETASLAMRSVSRRKRAGVRGVLSALDDDNVGLNLAVHIPSSVPLGDRFRRDVGCLAESRGVAGLDLVP